MLLKLFSQFVQAPANLHMDALIRTLRYIKGAPSQGLFFPSSSTSNLLASVTVIGADVNSLEDLCLVHVFSWVILLFLGNLWFLGHQQRLSIPLLQIAHVNYLG